MGYLEFVINAMVLELCCFAIHNPIIPATEDFTDVIQVEVTTALYVILSVRTQDAENRRVNSNYNAVMLVISNYMGILHTLICININHWLNFIRNTNIKERLFNS